LQCCRHGMNERRSRRCWSRCRRRRREVRLVAWVPLQVRRTICATGGQLRGAGRAYSYVVVLR
jgi:hypothetical protein